MFSYSKGHHKESCRLTVLTELCALPSAAEKRSECKNNKRE